MARARSTIRALASERGHALLIAVLAVAAAGLLGVALLEMGVIEAGLVTRDIAEVQALYCAEAQAARLYNLYAPLADPAGTLAAQTLPETVVRLAGRDFRVTGSAEVDPGAQTVTVTATCAMADGRTRTVQRQGLREFLPPPFHNALSSMGFDCTGGTCVQKLAGDLVLGGSGDPVTDGSGHTVGGRDRVRGDLYVAGWGFLRGQAQVEGFSPTDAQATITHYPGGGVESASPGFDPAAPGAVAQGDLPALALSPGIDEIRAALTRPDGTLKMRGSLGGSTIYNLRQIFDELGETREGNSERNLARPANCTFGVASADEKCQVWQEMAIVGARRTCAPVCASGVVNPDPPDSADPKASYYFMGIPRGTGLSPQQTSFPAIFRAVVGASAELQQLGFVANSFATLGSRLDAFYGLSPTGDGRVTRLVELTVGVDPDTGEEALRPAPPIFYVDGYWRADGGSSFAYNGRATVVATKSVVLSDNILYLGSLENVNLTLPPSTGACAPPASDRTACGLADVLGLVAREDLWYGDPGPAGATVSEIQAVMVAGRNANMFSYTSSAACCKGTDNPVTLAGTVVAGRQVQMMRDWAYPGDDRNGANQTCEAAGAGCRPVGFFRYDPADPARPNPHCPAGQTACWLFMTVVDGALVADPGLFHKAFLGCEGPEVCEHPRRRITHFQLNVNYDRRLRAAANILPPGLPTGGGLPYVSLSRIAWRDCGHNPSCS
jgi:hypothetical protein